MKVLKRILYSILGLVVLLCAFVLLCALKPEIADRLAGFLYPDRGASQAEDLREADGGSIQPGLAAGIFGGDAGAGQNGQEHPGGGTDTPQNRSDLVTGSGSGYTPPEQSGLAIPERVSGRNGYEPVREQEEELDEDAAGQIRDSLGMGETGDGLSFDPLYYPYYAMLDEKGQHLYRQIYANAKTYNRAFAPVEEVSGGQLFDVFSAVYNDHPELFWLNTAYSCKYVRGGSCVEIDLEFNRTAQDMENAQAQFDAEAERILSAAASYGSDYERERYVHDALIDKASYDLNAAMNQSAYSALVNGRTVCAGYARAYQYLMQQLGIPCYYCTGYAGESHAWNIVMLDNEFYNVDVTWDDTDGGNYDYFNKTDGDYADTHIRQELSVYLPPCTGERYRDLEQSGGDRVQDGTQEPEQGREQGQADGDGGQEQSQPDLQNRGGRELRSLEETGLSESDILRSRSEYYDTCYNRILETGAGTYTFDIVIEGEALLGELYAAYEAEEYRGAYLDSAMDALGVSSCTVILDVETLTQDRYLITHRMEFR